MSIPLLIALLAAATSAAPTPTTAPTLFEANLGAYHPDARLVAHRGAVHAYALDDGLVLRLDGSETAVALRARFLGGAGVAPRGQAPTPTRVQHLRGGTPDAWTTGAATFSRVRWDAVWPGIDVELYEADAGFEYDLRLAPGADLGAARLRWEGQAGVHLDTDGTLVLDTAAGPLVQAPPIVLLPDGRRVAGRFVLHAGSDVGFAVDGVDPDLGMVVDPILAFAAPAPAAGVVDVVAAGDGAVYVLGDTTAPDLPTTSGVLQGDLAGARDLWVARLDHSGHSMPWLTYLGGVASDEAAVAIDEAPDGSVVVGCRTSGTGFPVTPGAHDGSTLGWGSAVASLSPAGDGLNWSTYVITTNWATADLVDLVVADTGAVILGGTGCPCSDLAFSPGAARTTSAKTDSAFVARLAADGSQLEMATLIDDGDASAFGQFTGVEALDLDSAGRVVVLGRTNHTIEPTANAFQTGKPGNSDYFVAVVSADGTTYDYLSYLGTSGLEWWEGAALAVDASDRVWATWSTDSSAAPLSPDAWQATLGGGIDNVVTCLDPTQAGAASLVFSSYLGSWGNEEARGAGRSADGTIVIGFGTDSFASDHVVGSPGGNHGRIVLAEIDPATIGLSTTLLSFNGGEGFDARLDVAPDGDVVVCGGSNAPAPIAAGTAGGAPNNGRFVARVALDRPWMDLGRGFAGSAGTPRLVGAGDLTPSSPLTLTVSDALPDTAACIVFGLAFDDLPCKGGLLVTDPAVTLCSLVTDPTGGLVMPLTWPANVPAGVSAYAQVWQPDAGAEVGWSATNGLVATAP